MRLARSVSVRERLRITGCLISTQRLYRFIDIEQGAAAEGDDSVDGATPRPINGVGLAPSPPSPPFAAAAVASAPRRRGGSIQAMEEHLMGAVSAFARRHSSVTRPLAARVWRRAVRALASAPPHPPSPIRAGEPRRARRARTDRALKEQRPGTDVECWAWGAEAALRWH